MISNEQKKILLIAAIFVVFSILTAFFFLSQNNPTAQNELQKAEEKSELSELGLQRKKYGFPIAVFEELPRAPKDFFSIVSLMHAGKYTNYAFFPQEYFLQPEFFSSFKENALSYWLSPSPTHYAAAGYGF